jgi:hypothetical protein
MSQRQVERPQEKKPRSQDSGPKIHGDIDVGNIDDILAELDIVEHPEKYTEEQRNCGCFSPPKQKGFR